MERGFLPKIEMTINPDVISDEYIKDTMDEEGRVKGDMKFEEVNGVGSKIKELHSVFYESSGDIYDEFYSDIPKVFGEDCYVDPLWRKVAFYRFYYSHQIAYVIYSLKWIDDDGNKFETSCRLDLPGGGKQ